MPVGHVNTFTDHAVVWYRQMMSHYLVVVPEFFFFFLVAFDNELMALECFLWFAVKYLGPITTAGNCCFFHIACRWLWPSQTNLLQWSQSWTFLYTLGFHWIILTTALKNAECLICPHLICLSVAFDRVCDWPCLFEMESSHKHTGQGIYKDLSLLRDNSNSTLPLPCPPLNKPTNQIRKVWCHLSLAVHANPVRMLPCLKTLQPHGKGLHREQTILQHDVMGWLITWIWKHFFCIHLPSFRLSLAQKTLQNTMQNVALTGLNKNRLCGAVVSNLVVGDKAI